MKVKLVFLIMIFLITGCAKNKEVKIPISPEEIKEAINYGEKNASLTFTEFTKDWTIDYGYEYGKGKATLITPFLRVALLAKNAKEKNQKLDMKIVNLALKDMSDKIIFRVTIYGDYPTFGKTAKFYLEYNGKKVNPISSYTSFYSQFARDYTHISEGEVKFSNREIPKDAKIKLVVSYLPYETEKEKEKPKETICTFEFDLSKHR
jgi:hypothetical protein